MARWLEFEEEIRLLTEAFGYNSIRTPPTGDKGVDVIAEKNGRRVAIQVKLYSASSVGSPAIQMLIGGRILHGASEALLVTTSRLTKQAIQTCDSAGIHWLDGERLVQKCRELAITLPSWCHLLHPDYEAAYSLDQNLTIGRGAGADVVVPEDQWLSRTHCTLYRHDLNLYVQDMGSSNGTFLNGQRISRPTLINYLDELTTGGQRWIVVPGQSSDYPNRC